MGQKRSFPRQPAHRAPHLARLRRDKMVADAHAFVRASASLFYDTIHDKKIAFPEGPMVWISGDCHVENIGAVADAKGEASLEMNDLDEAVIQEPVLDVLRLALSFATAARGTGLSATDVLQATAGIARGYAEAVDRIASGSEEPPSVPMPKRLAKLMERAKAREQRELLKKRCSEKPKRGLHFPHGVRYWPVTKAERDAVDGLVRTPEVKALVTSMAGRPDADLTVRDVAFRIAGTGSLGCWRTAALVDIALPEKVEGGPMYEARLIDIKEALPLRAPRHKGTVVPEAENERVVAAARVLAPSLGHRMVSTSIGDRAVIVHELMAQDEKVSLQGLAQAEVHDVAFHLGFVVGRAHARQLHADLAAKWGKEFFAGGRADQPPPWLWASLISLVESHEAEYLRYAVSEEPAT